MYHFNSKEAAERWIIELNARTLELGKTLVFRRGADQTFSGSIETQIERIWAEKTAISPGLINGNLAHMNSIRFNETYGIIEIEISKTDYKKHHGTVPVSVSDEAWT